MKVILEYRDILHVLLPRLLLLLSHFSRVRICATPSLGFSRQEHWSGLPFPSPMHKSESEVTQSCLTLRDPMDYSLPGSSIHGIFQATVLEWGAIAFSAFPDYFWLNPSQSLQCEHQNVTACLNSLCPPERSSPLGILPEILPRFLSLLLHVVKKLQHPQSTEEKCRENFRSLPLDQEGSQD